MRNVASYLQVMYPQEVSVTNEMMISLPTSRKKALIETPASHEIPLLYIAAQELITQTFHLLYNTDFR